MKALSLWQPWASLIAIGAKKIETRSWPSSYHGRIAIHAAKRRPARNDDFDDALEPALLMPLFPHLSMESGPEECRRAFDRLPFGMIVCTAVLEECRKTQPDGEGYGVIPGIALGADERLFGNFEPGRFGWILSDVRLCASPLISVRGAQGLWDWTPPEWFTP